MQSYFLLFPFVYSKFVQFYCSCLTQFVCFISFNFCARISFNCFARVNCFSLIFLIFCSKESDDLTDNFPLSHFFHVWSYTITIDDNVRKIV